MKAPIGKLIKEMLATDEGRAKLEAIMQNKAGNNDRYFYIAFTGFVNGRPAVTSQFVSTKQGVPSFDYAIGVIKESTGYDGHWTVSFLFEFKNKDDYESAQERVD